MKKLKFVSFMTLCVILLQIVMPILMDVEWNNVVAASTNTWDVSKNGDGSVVATLSDDGTFTVSGNGEMKNYSSSNNIAYYSKKDEIKKVVINEGVTRIGDYAFYGCTSLSSVNIPESVISIGLYAFSGCTSLSSINIPNNVISIEVGAFCNCTSLSSINIPKGVTSLEESIFEDCTSLSSINIPESVTSIGWYAFSGCTSLSSINIPNNVISIGEGAFGDCTSLSSINIPKGVTSLEESIFENCTSLSSINIPESVTSIGDYAFFWCESLSSINIPESVISIGDHAFDGCESISSINIGNGVTSIGDYAFGVCTSLSSINIPESVTSIGEDAFWWCNKLTIYCKTDSYAKEYAEENNLKYVTDDVAPIIESIAGNEKWTKDQITLTVNATDELSGLAEEAYSFDNGQTWQKENTKIYTENTKGIIVKVRDVLGNIATYKAIDINNILKIEIKDYEIITIDNEKYLTKINEKTTVSQLKEKIQTNGTIKVLKGETEITDPNTYVGTGMTIQVESEKYTVVIKADLNGDGTIGLSDLANIKLGLIGKVDLSTAQKLAGDVNENGNMALSDMANLKMYLLKK